MSNVSFELNKDFFPFETITMENGRAAIAEHLELLTKEFQNGVDVEELVVQRTKLIDSLLCKLWTQFGLNKFPDLALVAVGGYGRGDLQPHSDIDILFVNNGDMPEELNNIIPIMNTLLWDLKLDVGQSVRTIEECVSEGKKDITIATNLLESRFIVGCHKTFIELYDIVNSDSFWSKPAFYDAKVNEQKERYRYYKDTIYLLEPDIKNNPGCLRDIHTILWCARRTFGAKTLKDMQNLNLLTRLEYFELLECQSFLWRLRFALHLSINRPDNRLTFDRQVKVAASLGYEGEGNAAVETLMKRFYQTVHRVRELNSIVLQLIEQFLFPHYLPEGKIINQNFIIRGTLLDVVNANVFIEQPETILETFLILTERTELTGIYIECIRHLRNARRSLNFYLDEKEECRELFKKIIRNPRSLRVAIPLMHRHNILSLYLPHWQEISGLMQFDMFHSYTVDEHTIRVLKNIYEFSNVKNHNFTLYRQVYSQIEQPELLFIAALLHDIAKGRQGHHAELGAPDALYFCQLHNYNRYESRLVSWIVRNHLYMSLVAQRRDISDPEVVAEFAKKVGDESYLNYLYCLTVADICATNDKEWTTYKDSLLRTLYFSARDALRKGLENPPDLRLHVRENQQKALTILTKIGVSSLDIFKVWENFKLEYFIRYMPEQIAWHTQNIINHKHSNKPLILFGQNNQINGTELFVYTKDVQGLFARVTGALGDKQLNILTSIISNTNDNYALDTFVFVEKYGEQLPYERLSSLRKSITKSLLDENYTPPKPQPLSDKLKQFSHPTIVTFLTSKDTKTTQLEISTLDVPGLLSKIGNVFQKNGFSIHAAKITTTGERADDFFSITNNCGKVLNNNEKDKLTNLLIEELDNKD